MRTKQRKETERMRTALACIVCCLFGSNVSAQHHPRPTLKLEMAWDRAAEEEGVTVGLVGGVVAEHEFADWALAGRFLGGSGESEVGLRFGHTVGEENWFHAGYVRFSTDQTEGAHQGEKSFSGFEAGLEGRRTYKRLWFQAEGELYPWLSGQSHGMRGEGSIGVDLYKNFGVEGSLSMLRLYTVGGESKSSFSLRVVYRF